MRRSFPAIVALVTLLVYAASSLPYLAGYAFQTRAARFTGIVFDVPDTAQYYAWMRAFARQPLIANPLTPEAGHDRFFNLQWWLLGPLAYGTPLGPNGAYQVLRLVALAAFALALAAFCSHFARPHRAAAFTLVMVASGFGWVLIVAKQVTGELRDPLSVQIAEANTYFSAMAFPHLLIAGALTLSIFVALFGAAGARPPVRARRLALIALPTLALGFSHGYDLLPLLLIPGATVGLLLWRRRGFHLWLPLATLVASAAPPALYVLSLTRLDATWRGVLGQYGNAGVFTPSPPHLVILLGLPFLLALWQLRPRAWDLADERQTFLRVWLVVGFALAYLPTNYQIKMLTTYQVPACLLAAQTLHSLHGALARRDPPMHFRPRAPHLTAVALAAVMLTNVYLTAWRVLDLQRTQYPYYLSASDVQALEALEGLAHPGQVVLSSPDLGVFVPVYSDARPFVAHWAQTLDFFARRYIAARIYDPDTPPGEREALIAAHQIAFVLAGPAAADLGGTDRPIALPLERIALPAVGAGRLTAIYRTRLAAQAGTKP